MKVVYAVLLIIILLSTALGCSPKALEIIGVSISSGSESYEIMPGIDTPVEDGSILTIRFSEPLAKESSDILSHPCELVAPDTLTFKLVPELMQIQLPADLRGKSGGKLGTDHTFSFSLIPDDPHLDPWSLIKRASLSADSIMWEFNPQEVTEIVVPGQGSVTFFLHGGKLLTFELYPGVEEVVFSLEGHDFRYSVRYIEAMGEAPLLELGLVAHSDLRLPFEGVLPVLREDSILLTLNWPFAGEEIESRLRSALRKHLRALQWTSPQTLVVHVSGEPGEVVSMGLGDLTIIPGYSPDRHIQTATDYSLEFLATPVIKRANIGTGEHSHWEVPFHVDEVSGWNEEEQLASMRRIYYLPQAYDESHLWRQEFFFSFRENRVVGEVVTSSDQFPRSQQNLYATAKLEWPPGAYSFSHVGGSLSGKLSAALFCSPDGNLMLIHDNNTGNRVLHDLSSSSSRHGGGGGTDMIFWNHDETHVIYKPYDDDFVYDSIYPLKGPGIYAMGMASGQEQLLWTGDATIVSASSVNDVVLIEDNGHFLVDFAGHSRLLPELPSSFSVVQWLHPEAFLAKTENQSFIYDLNQEAVTWTIEGQAFAMDVPSGYIYILEK